MPDLTAAQRFQSHLPRINQLRREGYIDHHIGPKLGLDPNYLNSVRGYRPDLYALITEPRNKYRRPGRQAPTAIPNKPASKPTQCRTCPNTRRPGSDRCPACHPVKLKPIKPVVLVGPQPLRSDILWSNINQF